MKKYSGSPVYILQLAVAVFFISAGIAGIINYQPATNEFAKVVDEILGKTTSPWTITIAVFELIAGCLLIAGMFVSARGKSAFFAAIIVCILWGIYIVYTHLSTNFSETDFIFWLYRASPDIVVLASLWVIAKKYA